MERYINSYATENDIQIALENGELLKPYVAYIEDADRIDWNSKTIDYSGKYLTFNILSAGTINWTASKTDAAKTIDYKLNDGEWTPITSNTGSSAPTINVVEGDKLQFRGNNATYAINDYFSLPNSSFSGSTASFEVEGNIMSLIYGDDFKNNSTISSACTFAGLFQKCAKLVSVENLILPSTTLTNKCYNSMFSNCTSLTTVPSNLLPATTLTDNCYSSMFYNCTSLTVAPELPATTLATHCYDSMFLYCKLLTTAPKELPATTLAERCCYRMFYGCTSLTTAPALPATTLANGCYYQMFYICTSLTAAPALPATTLATQCYEDMFISCTSLTAAPSILPATTLAERCYAKMFKSCSSLTVAPELPATTLTNACYLQMFGGCTSLNYIKCLATDISATNCTYNWVGGVAATGTFVKSPNMTSWSTGENGIPTGWTVQDA